MVVKVFNQYGFWGGIKLIKNILLTKLIFPSARLVKFPIDIRNKRSIQIGRGFSTGIFCRIESYPYDYSQTTLKIGDNFKINDYVHIAAHKNVQIGNNVLVASNVFITDLSHGSYSGENHDMPETIVGNRMLFARDVIIQDNVWIGQNSIILPGVSIGRNAIIGAGAVVTKNIPNDSIAVGNPAKVIKCYCYATNKWIEV